MATTPQCKDNFRLDSAEGFRYLARQPILDMRGRLHGYELLFRDEPGACFPWDGNRATRTMLDNSVVFGLEKLTGGALAFINCTEESLTDELVDVLPASMTVLEVLEDLEPTPVLVSACRRLKRAGFRLALDDFTWKPGIEPLVELADYVKIDFLAVDAHERKLLLDRLSYRAVALVAEKVETREQFKTACDEGFTLVQGYHFCRPVMLRNRKIPANRLSQIEILCALQDETADLRNISRLVKRDTSLTYRILRLINSPMYAVQQEVRSVEEALVVIGEDAFRRVATLAITSDLNAGQNQEVLRLALVRGRFCELAARVYGLNPTEQYLVGMLSLLPAMLRIPMDELTPSLPLREEIRQALNDAESPVRGLLAWVIANEQGDWTLCSQTARRWSMDSAPLQRCYAQAIVWAESVLHFA